MGVAGQGTPVILAEDAPPLYMMEPGGGAGDAMPPATMGGLGVVAGLCRPPPSRGLPPRCNTNGVETTAALICVLPRIVALAANTKHFSILNTPRVM